ncbi:MAG TPA: haloalkane dehalogenase [Candidatus Binataceae bacterium]|nr:haloalkane dehalogenase [Candidatus Binataceae bacterium]
MSMKPIEAVDPFERKRVQVLDSTMSYVDTGSGEPVVFLHGNPTSSYLWRNIIPYLGEKARCLAPDLIGMGASGRSANGAYTFIDHVRYLDAWFEKLGLGRNVTLVLHDWGSALGFHWANRHRAAIKGIAYMEAIVAPLTWSDWPGAGRGIFQAMRSDAGEELVLQKNIFIERILPASILREMSAAELEAYRQPFREPGESRRPMLTWPRQIPIDGEPAEVTQIVSEYARWLAASAIPKLFVNADPGMILSGRVREQCRRWPNQREVTVKGLHFIQEDSPHEIGAALSAWYEQL